MVSIEIREELIADHQPIRDLLHLAFAGPAEAQLVDDLRNGGHVALSLIAVADGQIVCHLLFSRLLIHQDSGLKTGLSLAPLAVAPDRQKQGIGSRLIREGLARCEKEGHSLVIVLGTPGYYRKFGFSSDLAKGLTCPFSGTEAFMALELGSKGAKLLQGRVEYAAPFGAFT